MAALPALPGVYRYFDAEGGVLYVGKARNLKKRVSSYFQKNHGGTRIGHMVTKIVRMETTVVRSEAEALLLENNLIKTLNPKYNILFRDDKSYPYLKMTGAPGQAGEGGAPSATAFPRMCLLPGRGREKAPLLRPLPQRLGGEGDDLAAAKGVQAAHLRGHGVQQPHPALPAVPDQALLGALRGPCVARALCAGRGQRRALFAGETQEMLSELEARMMAHADRLEFEQAAELRNQMSALSKVLHQQSMEIVSTTSDVDILAVKVQGGKACVNLAMVRGGRHLGDRPYFPTHVEDAADVGRAGCRGR